MMARVLIIDDEEAYCRYLGAALKRQGYEVATARSGHEGIECAATFEPDVLVTDWMLQNDYTGLDVAQILGDQQPDLRTIIITGYLSGELRRQADEAGMFRFIEKPFESAEVLSAVDAALH